MEMLARQIKGNIIQCTACNRYCVIPEGDAGFCGVRANEKGRLNLLVNERPAAIWSDPIEKKPLFHFLPGSQSFSLGTLGCNFACEFCQNWDISQAPQEARKKDPKKWRAYFDRLVQQCQHWPAERVVESALANKCRSISFTYTEPTIFAEYAVEVMKKAGKHNLKGVFVTNGYESKECWDYIRPYIDAVNIDLKAYNQKFYSKLCRVPDFTKVKESIEYAKKKGLWTEVTTLLIPGWNDDMRELKQAAEWLASVDPEMPWHVTAFHPDYRMMDTPKTLPESLLKARQTGLDAGIKYVYVGNVGMAYSQYESTVCHSCGELLIERHGMSASQNKMKDGKCPNCKTEIKGVWK
ncbi:AmmeMemoRadiSam system radical SAM enzyme [Candidatus Micrarchaeota archaeon]|nr:AmmeMemoRadiSam system radical SAM enzyme [Candidatus Micrarchaeota archaeon]